MKNKVAAFVAILTVGLFSLAHSVSADEWETGSYSYEVSYDYGYTNHDNIAYQYGEPSPEPEASCFNKGDTLPLGAASVVYALTQVSSVEVIAYDEDRTATWSDTVEVAGPVTSQSQMVEVVKGITPSLSINDPRKRIIVEAYLKDSSGRNLFSAYSSSEYRKNYDSDGNPYYELTSPYLGFYLDEFTFSFCDEVESARFEYESRGNTYTDHLEIEDGQILMPGWYRNRSGTLIVEFDDGTVVRYDSRTGQALVPQQTEVVFRRVSIGGLRTFQLNSKEFNHSVPVEYGQNEALEIEPMFTGWSEFNINSWNGYRPIAAWINTMDGVASGQDWEFVAVDWQGDFQLEFDAGEKFLIIVEWPDHVYNTSNGGGKG